MVIFRYCSTESICHLISLIISHHSQSARVSPFAFLPAIAKSTFSLSLASVSALQATFIIASFCACCFCMRTGRRHVQLSNTLLRDFSRRASATKLAQTLHVGSRPRNGGELPAKLAPLTSSLPLVPLTPTSQCFSAGSGHDYHHFHAFPLLRSNTHLLRLPFEL